MSGRVNLLSVLLAVQLIVVAGLLWVRNDAGGGTASGPLLSFDPDRVDRIRLSGERPGATAEGDDEGSEAPLILERTAAGWQLSDGSPADAAKIDGVLLQLADLDAAWPVATTSDARSRFEVTAEAHQRHVELLAGETPVADFYLGTSPGYQQVHARKADADEVYSVDFANFQLPVTASDWLDKTLLEAQGEVTAVARDGAWRLEQDGDAWRLDGAPADADASADLARRFADLRITGVSGAPEDEAAVASFAVTDAAGTYRLALYPGAEENSYRVTSDRRPGVFALAGYVADGLLADADTLKTAAGEDAADSAATDTDEPEAPAAEGTPAEPSAVP